MFFFGKKGEKMVVDNNTNDKSEISSLIKEWIYSEKRKEMLCGLRYYCGENDILFRKRTVIGEDGVLKEDKTLSNNRLAHGFFKKLVDQKCQYLFSLPFTVLTDDKEYSEYLQKIFDTNLRKKIQNLCKEAVIKGIAWLEPYFDNGNLSFKKIPSEEVLPIWKDSEHTVLEALVRIYNIKRDKKKLTQIEYWTLSGVEYFIMENGRVSKDSLKEKSSHIVIDGKGYNFKKIPFIPFRYNEEEIPLIRYTKSLIDDYDLLKSDDSNAITDVPNSILVVKNYDGQSLGEFRKNLSQYKAVKVSDDGGLDIKTTKLSTDLLEKHLLLDRKDLYEVGRGVDTQNDDFKNASGVALKFLYADLDLDCNGIESEFLVGFEAMIEFINLFLKLKNKGDFSDKRVSFTLNRDIIINEDTAIENCIKSREVLSERTVIENHPWVDDVNEEILRKENENGE